MAQTSERAFDSWLEHILITAAITGKIDVRNLIGAVNHAPAQLS